MKPALAAGIAAFTAFAGGLLYASCEHHHASISFRKTEVRVDPPPRLVLDDIDAAVDLIVVVNVGAPTVDGDYPADEVARRVETWASDLRACARSGHLHGTVTVYFAIRASGETAYANADATDLDAAQCLAKAFDEMVFPPPDGGEVITASVPLTFSP